MASSPMTRVVSHEVNIGLKDIEQGHNLQSNSQTQTQQVLSTPNPTVFDKTLSNSANLAQLLPTGTVLAFQALSPSFTNHGECFPSNKYLTALLLYLCLLSSILFCFTDSLIGQDKKLYYGFATFKGFYVFNFSGSGDEAGLAFNNLQKLRIKKIDYVHAFFSALVFLSVSFSDAGIQSCFFDHASRDATELLVNLPLGAAFVSSFVFMLFPTTRKGIGYTNVTHQS